MNSKCAINGKNKRLIIASIIFTMAIIMCGNGIISNTNISKKTTKKVVIQKEIVDGVEIKILADRDVFPQDARATIKKIDKESDTSKVKSAIKNSVVSSKQKIKSVYSYDITIKDSKGNELQPDTSKGEVLVAFKDIKGIDKDNGKNVQVWHVKDDLNKAEEVKSGVEVANNDVDVKVQHFSIYSIVINEEQDKSIKYFEGASDETSYFMIEDAEDLCLFRDIVNGVISDTAPILVEYENEDANNKKENIKNISTLVKNARLMNDIGTTEEEIKWDTAIGTNEEPFNGMFDGSYRYEDKVYNLYILTEGSGSENAYGLFGGIDNNAKINVNVNNNPYKTSNVVKNIKYLEGAGTVKSPYLIKTAEDFKYMADTISEGIAENTKGIINGSESSIKARSACYKLDNSIGNEGIDLGDDWKPICPVKYQAENIDARPNDNEIGFEGIIDGNRKKIKFSSTVGGLFGKITEKAIIKNLVVDGIITKYLPGSDGDNEAYKDDSMVCLGTLVGISYGNIVNCNIGGSITTKNDKIYKNRARIGGVAGDNMGVISGSKCAVEINVKNISEQYIRNARVGGMVGENEENAIIEDCGYISETDEGIVLNNIDGFAGGIVGRNVGKINKVSYKTNVSIIVSDKLLYYGGICGGLIKGEIRNAMVNSTIILKKSGESILKTYMGGIFGLDDLWDNNNVYNSYSNVKIDVDSNSWGNVSDNTVFIGGVGGKIIDSVYNDCILNNCYSIMVIDDSINNNNVDNLVGVKKKVLSNCNGYYYNIEANQKTENNIPDDFVGILNYHSNTDYCQWIEDTNNTNDDYPILDFTKKEVKPYPDEVDASTINIYGNGCSIIIKESQSGYTEIYHDVNNNGKFDEEIDKKIALGVESLSNKTINVFGGSKYKLYCDTRITMLGGTVTNIYGGGNGASSEVNNTVIDIKGGNVNNVYGGSYKGLVKGSSTINISGGNITNTYGGSYNGLVIDSSTINISGGTIDNIYGGSYNGLVKGSSTIKISGGTINNVYGAGEYTTDGDSGQVLCGTTINITGGSVKGFIDANGKSSGNEAKTVGNKIINVSGSPIIGNLYNGSVGINLDSFTNKKIIVDNALSLRENKKICVITTPDLRKKIALLKSREYADVNQFYINNLTTSMPRRTLFKYNNSANKVEILIAEQLDSELSLERTNVISNNTINELGYGFGTNTVAKGYEWKGTIKAKPGYTLPPTIEVKIGGNVAVQGTDYKYDKYTGEVTVFKGKTTGNIKVTAEAIYVPPILYVNKPSINNTDFTYTGTPQSPILIDTDKYTVSVTRETNVGEYTMVVSLKDKVYTRWNDGTNDDLYIKWRINKVDLKVIAKDKSIIYGDSPTNAGVSYEGFVNGENQSVLKGDLSYDYNYARYDNVGNYVITPKGYEADNYNITYTSGTLKVFPKKLSFKWSSLSKFKYDGKAKVMTASIVGIVNNDDVRIASYAHNKTDKVGTYVAKVTGITGTKKDNYTLEGATNISKKWSIVKTEDKEDKDKNEDKDNIKDNGDKNDTSGSNNNDKGNVNNNKNNNNNSSNNTSSNKGNNNNNQSNGNYDKVNMYDKLANNNDYKTDIEGAIEGVKTSDNEIQVELNNGMIISAMGDFEESIRLMVKEIKNKRKEWRWINSLTKDIGTNKGLYDIFFVNSKGVKVNTGKGTKISILSREKLQKADVYYIRTSSERLKLKSWKEEYTVKFKMVENGYYTLILNDKNNLIEGKGDDVNVVDKDSTTDNNDKNANKDADTINDKDNQDGTEEDKTNENASKDGDGGSEINTSQDSTNHNIQNIGKQQKEKEDGINWLIIISIIFVIIVTIIVSVFILKRFSKDRYEVE